MIDNPAKLLPFVSIEKGQTGRVHRSSDPPVAIRHSAVQIENNRVRPGTKLLQNRITMVRAESGEIEESLSVVMAGHSRSKNGVAPLAYVPAIHVFPDCRRRCKTWMPGTRPGMTPIEERACTTATTTPHGGRSSAAIHASAR